MNSNTPDSDDRRMAADHVGEVLREMREMREMREACGKNQSDVASKADLPRKGLHLIETQQGDSWLRNVERIAQSAGSSLRLTSVVITADARLVFAGSFNGKVHVWDAASGKAAGEIALK